CGDTVPISDVGRARLQTAGGHRRPSVHHAAAAAISAACFMGVLSEAALRIAAGPPAAAPPPVRATLAAPLPPLARCIFPAATAFHKNTLRPIRNSGKDSFSGSCARQPSVVLEQPDRPNEKSGSMS